MAHQRPGREIVRVEFQSSMEIQHSFLMLGAQTVVITCKGKNLLQKQGLILSYILLWTETSNY